jgi:2-iminobutanoate/2-iminopropanoate deaminase
MPRKTVESQHGPRAIGPYSHAVWAGDILYLSGQTPIDPSTNQLVTGDIAAQTQRVFDNLQAVLVDAGLTIDDVVKCNVYLTAMRDFAGMNAVYQTRFVAPYPARTTVAVAELPLGALVEIEVVARRTTRTE